MTRRTFRTTSTQPPLRSPGVRPTGGSSSTASGYGSAMIANKIAGIYAAVCQDPFCAELARSHSDTNVLCLGGKIIGSAIAMEIVRVWMATDWLGVAVE